MPLFEYQCQACQREFELLIRGREVPACPACQSTDLAKRFSAPAAIVKGGELPLARQPAGCGAPSCCLGRCQS